MSYFDDASLVMIPSGYKTSKVYSVKPTDGSGDLTFSRSNDTATRVNSAGLIEKVRTNLVLQSQAFNTTWTPDNGGGSGTATITANSHSAPDGTMTADRIQIARGSVYMNIYQNVSSTAGLKYTASVYLKSLSGTPNISILYDSVPYSVTLTTDWVRYSVTYTASGSSTAPLLGLFGGNSATADIVAWGYQLEVSDFGATPYIATTTAAVSVGPVANVPRLDYLNSSCPRLLLEPQRTNLIQYSEQFNNAWWSPSNSTISANAVTSPDGYTNADNLVENTANSTHGVGNVSGLTLTAAAYTFSVFVKKQNRNFFAISTYDGSSTLEGYFNINTGAVATMPAGLTGAITSYGNGWYRCSVTRTMGANANNYFSFNAAATDGGSTYTGTGVVACSIYGGSLELAAYATSYIPTLGAAVTRGADAASKTSASALIGQTEGVLYIECDIKAVSELSRLLFVSDGTLNNFINIYIDSDNKIYATTRLSASTVSLFASNTLTAGTYKIAYAYKANDFILYINGTAVSGSSSANIPATSRLDIGSRLTSSSYFNSFVNQAILFPTRLSNSDLAALTA